MNETFTFTREDLVNAYRRWIREANERPQEFAYSVDPEVDAEASANYLLHLLTNPEA